MSAVPGGGIRTVRDVKLRCHVPPHSCGCWEWRGALDGAGYPTMWIPELQRALRVGQALCFLVHGREIERGFTFAPTKCGRRDCANPAHRSEVKRNYHNIGKPCSSLRAAQVALGKRQASKLSDAAVAEIRSSNETVRVAAAKWGIDPSYVSKIRRFESRSPVVHGASIFGQGAR